MDSVLELKLIPRDEAWLHEGEVAVPLEITLRKSEAQIQYYPAAKPILDEFLKRFGKSAEILFSKEAVSWANERFGDFLGQYGFELSPDSATVYLNHTLSEVNGDVPDFVCRIYGNEGYNDLTGTDIDGLTEAGYIIYAAIIGNDIVALANTGVPITVDTEQEVEIGVDTAENHRRNGYGKACVTALTGELLRMGHTAIYECAARNDASVGLIKSFGGELVSRKFYIVGFREDLEENYGI